MADFKVQEGMLTGVKDDDRATSLSEEQSPIARLNPNSTYSKLAAAIQLLIGRRDYVRLLQLVQALAKSRQDQSEFEKFLDEYKQQVNSKRNNSVDINAGKIIENKAKVDVLIDKLQKDKREVEVAIEGLKDIIKFFQGEKRAAVNIQAYLAPKLEETKQTLVQLTEQHAVVSQTTQLPFSPAYLQEYLASNLELAANNQELVEFVNRQQSTGQPKYASSADPAYANASAPSEPTYVSREDTAYVNASAPMFDENDYEAETPFYDTPQADLVDFMEVERKRRAQEQEVKDQMHQAEALQQSYVLQYEIAHEKERSLDNGLSITNECVMLLNRLIQNISYAITIIPDFANSDQGLESSSAYNDLLYRYMSLRNIPSPYYSSNSNKKVDEEELRKAGIDPESFTEAELEALKKKVTPTNRMS